MNSILIDVTYNCNLNCKHCYNKDNIEKIYNADMDIDLLEKIIYRTKVKHVHLLGGEPLLYKNLNSLIRSNKHTIFTINTNGLLIEKNIKLGLFDNINLKEITISIDGFNSHSNDKIRGKGTYNIVLENYKKLLAFKQSHRKDLIISISTVLLPENVDSFDLNFFDCFCDVDNLLISTLYDIKESYNINKESFYNKYFDIIYKISKQDKIKNILFDTTPLIMYFLDIYDDNNIKCNCNSDNSIFYLDNMGSIYSCIPQKNKYKKNNINIYCEKCPFFDKCSACRYNIYFKRVSYCKAAINILKNRYTTLLNKNIIIKKYYKYIFLFNKYNKKLLKLTNEEFYFLFILKEGKLLFKEDDNQIDNLIRLKEFLEV